MVFTNLKYWGAPRHDGFVLMPNEVEAYRLGPNAFEFKGTNGFMITVDIGSKDIAREGRHREVLIRPLFSRPLDGGRRAGHSARVPTLVDLLRHGDALAADPAGDAARRLSPAGIEEVRRLAVRPWEHQW